jgi:LysM repeat protein
MKPTLLLATLALGFTSPAALSQSELEKLRALCAEQDRQIRLLEEENSRLRSLATREKTRSYPVNLISNPSPATTPVRNEPSNGTYTVVAGDNLAKIARKVGGTPEAIAKLNGITINSVIHPGQKLKVPTAAGANAAKPAAAVAAAPTPTTPAPASGATHTVKPGDTFYGIAKKHGISTEALMAANPGVKPAALQVGRTLNLAAAPPLKPATAAAPANPTPAPKPLSAPTPASPSSTAAANIPDEPVTPAPADPPKAKPRTVSIEREMSLTEFATLHGTTVERLNRLNGLHLAPTTVMAKGSELHVPGEE